MHTLTIFSILVHLQYNTIFLSSSEVYDNEWHLWYFGPLGINSKSFDSNFKIIFRHQLRLFHAPKSSAIAEKFSAKSIVRTNYALEYNLLSKNRVTHFRPIMTFLVKLLETHPMMSAISGFIKTG